MQRARRPLSQCWKTDYFFEAGLDSGLAAGLGSAFFSTGFASTFFGSGFLASAGAGAGLAAGANVIMPNFTPSRERAAYDLYEGKHAATVESDGMLPGLIQELTSAGYTLAQTRGDYKENAYV